MGLLLCSYSHHLIVSCENQEISRADTELFCLIIPSDGGNNWRKNTNITTQSFADELLPSREKIKTGENINFKNLLRSYVGISIRYYIIIKIIMELTAAYI